MGMLRIAIVLALSGLISFVAVSDASACSNSIARTKANAKKPDLDLQRPRVVWSDDLSAITKASDALNAGRNADVIVGMYDHFGLDINSWALNPKTITDREREVVLMVALAVLRTEGAVERHHKLVASKPRRQVDNVRWAVRAMEGLAYARFVPERHIVEAWGRDPALKELATKKLLELRKKGELLSPFQFDLLARLLREHGEVDAAKKVELTKLEFE